MPLLVSQILTVQSLDADARQVKSPEKATEVTEPLWPSSVCRQVPHSSLIDSFNIIQLSSSCLKRPFIRLQVELNISADAYT